MAYEMLVLDLDGTLTTSEKVISPPTKSALKEIQKIGKHVVLASGRPTHGIVPLAEDLNLSETGGYILSFNGARIINCKTGDIIYDKPVPPSYLPLIYDYAKEMGMNLVTYKDNEVISAFEPNQESLIEAEINKMPIRQVDDFLSYVDFPVNKLLITGDPEVILTMEKELKKQVGVALNIYRSEPYFLEIMAPLIDKAHSLQRLLNSLGLKSEHMICCGDGYNDLTMIESAGLGVAMANAQPAVLDAADYITKSNDEDGVLHVINEFILKN